MGARLEQFPNLCYAAAIGCGIEGALGRTSERAPQEMLKKGVTIELDAASLRRIDDLVEAELFADRASATKFLIAEGIKANAEMLGKVRDGLDALHRVEEQIGRPQQGEAESNVSTRKEAIAALTKAVRRHEMVRRSTIRASELLFEQRTRAASEVVERGEAYVNRLANSPKEFDRTIAEYRVEAGRFDDDVERLRRTATHSTRVGSATRAAGALAGVGVAALGPSAALAVATTFGTASTGAAISALSGAAATNAALAWLGGGALAVGGGGMAAGNALLALAGPVGLTVAGFAFVGSAVYLHARNRKCVDEANAKRAEVEAETHELTDAVERIDSLANLIGKFTDGCLTDLAWFTEHAPVDYRGFDDHHKKRLAALINNIGTLARLLREQVTIAAA